MDAANLLKSMLRAWRDAVYWCDHAQRIPQTCLESRCNVQSCADSSRSTRRTAGHGVEIADASGDKAEIMTSPAYEQQLAAATKESALTERMMN